MLLSLENKTIIYQEAEPHPWILLEYPQPLNITKVVIKNRRNCCGDRFRDIEVRVTKEKPELSKKEAFTGKFTWEEWYYFICHNQKVQVESLYLV